MADCPEIKGLFWQGCALHPPRQQQQQQQQRAFRGMAGRCGLAGHAVNPPPGSGPAAGGCAFGRLRGMPRRQSALTHGGSMAPCSCALSCAHGKTGVGRPAQPARGMPRAHGANGPANPHRPTSDRFTRLLVGVDLGRHICQISNSRLGSEPVARQRDPTPCSDRSRKTVEGGEGPVAGVSAAWMPRPSSGGHFMDGFTASPATGPTPPSHRNPAFALAVAVAPTGSRCRAAGPAEPTCP